MRQCATQNHESARSLACARGIRTRSSTCARSSSHTTSVRASVHSTVPPAPAHDRAPRPQGGRALAGRCRTRTRRRACWAKPTSEGTTTRRGYRRDELGGLGLEPQETCASAASRKRERTQQWPALLPRPRQQAMVARRQAPLRQAATASGRKKALTCLTIVSAMRRLPTSARAICSIGRSAHTHR